MLKLSKDNPFNPAIGSRPAVIPRWIDERIPSFASSTIENYLPLIAYSFDRFLPIIKLREQHSPKTELQGWLVYYFYFHQLMGFVLASLLIAGITGLTTK